MSNNIYSVSDARAAAKRRLPTMIFDYVDGAAGEERAAELNNRELDNIRLLPRVLVNVDSRHVKKSLLGREWELPFGIAPMGMCDLTWPGADAMLAAAAVKYGIPIGLSTMASSDIETTRQRAGDNAWFQLYVGQSEELGMELVDRAEAAGYDTLILTVDVPMIAPRPREQRNGFQSPVKIGPKLFFDFALHPQWSIRTLLNGVPQLANNLNSSSGEIFVRNEGRGKIDWAYLNRLRQRWKGKLIVKGVLSPEDAVRIRDADVDALYVSNHGGRQLDSAPSAISMLPVIRAAVGEEYPIIFDSGVRNGEAVIKALALGADFVMLGRPFMYGIGADCEAGLDAVIKLLINQIDTTLAQLGRTNINDIDSSVVFGNSVE
jgi:isopentenyl diphosphate isomerase/L-lactate dehydrogenase-like FMN-dependent dehydrogenase